MRGFLTAFLLLAACAETPADQAVYTFFDAMRQGDANLMVSVLDSTVFASHSGVPELDTLFVRREFEDRRNRILQELTGGELKRLWLSKQVIVGRSEFGGDTAEVEVSFVDSETEKHFLTRFGLTKKGKTWKIFRFKSP